MQIFRLTMLILKHNSLWSTAFSLPFRDIFPDPFAVIACTNLEAQRANLDVITVFLNNVSTDCSKHVREYIRAHQLRGQAK